MIPSQDNNIIAAQAKASSNWSLLSSQIHVESSWLNKTRRFFYTHEVMIEQNMLNKFEYIITSRMSSVKRSGLNWVRKIVQCQPIFSQVPLFWQLRLIEAEIWYEAQFSKLFFFQSSIFCVFGLYWHYLLLCTKIASLFLWCWLQYFIQSSWWKSENCLWWVIVSYTYKYHWTLE